VVQALKLTAPGSGVRLRQLTAGGGGLKMGRLWTAVIVSQIAATLAFPTLAYMTWGEIRDLEAVDVGLPAEEYLTAAVKLDAGREAGESDYAARAAFAARFASSFERLARRLEEDPHVLGVTYADRLPRMFHPHRLVEVDGGGAAPLHPHWPEGYRVSSAAVAPRYFEVVQAPILAGRDFRAADAGRHVVIVNQSHLQPEVKELISAALSWSIVATWSRLSAWSTSPATSRSFGANAPAPT
jgi:hypothetical protein